MAGFVFNLNREAALEECIHQGAYGTILGADPVGYWATAHEATFGDYCTMKEGDGVFFFTSRKLFGVGRLVKVGSDCRFQNFPAASESPTVLDVEKKQFLLDKPWPTTRQRWMCVFEPDPHFFRTGVDMDDALTYRPEAFRTLRAMWRRSFVRVDDEEEQALRDVIYRANRQAFADPSDEVFSTDFESFHAEVKAKLSPSYRLDPKAMLDLVANDDGSVGHEMPLEAALVYQLTEGDQNATNVFGEMSYVAHQVTGSPPKPPMYIDHIDVLGLSYLHGRTPSHYTIIEMKKGAASLEDVEQTMKYIDWVKDEYCFGDYSMVQGFLVAFDFPLNPADAEPLTQRTYTVGRRPAETRHWREFVPVRYQYKTDSGLRFLPGW